VANDGRAGDVTICVRAVSPIPDSAYLERSDDRLRIASDGFVHAFGQAASDHGCAGFAHTHPGSEPWHSPLDDRLDEELALVAQRRTPGAPYLSLVVGGTSSAPTFAARMFFAGDQRRVDVMRVVGPSLRVYPANPGSTPDRFERQARALGEGSQAALAALRVGVAGAGGTGSAVVEQLVRLGVGEVVVADDDVVDETNLTRIYGSRDGDVGRPKVDVVREYASSISSATRVVALRGRVDELVVARRMRHCDVLFGCTDDHAGRSVLARLAFWYLLPLIDTGIVVHSDRDHLEVTGRVTIIVPGTACLLCRDRIDPKAIATDRLPTAERRRLAKEGYVSGPPGPAPSVVAYTALTASTAVSELLNRLFVPTTDEISELILQVDQHAIRINTIPPRPGHFCANPNQWGRADEEPFLGQLWAERQP
jgi:molybdopterin/thiamine biosynthesis adenylyltransferase